MDDDRRLTSLRALAHPARLQILSLLTSSEMSAAEVAREIGTTQANASYHLRRLHDAGEVELAEQVTIRGGTARRYRHVPTTPDPVMKQPTEGAGAAERQFYATLATELQRRATARVATPHGTNTDAELWLDPEVWAQAVRKVSEVSLLLHRAAQPPRTPGAVRTNTTIAMFGMDATARPSLDATEEGS